MVRNINSTKTQVFTYKNHKLKMKKELKPFHELVMQECLALKQSGQVSFENMAESYNAIFQMSGFMMAELKPAMFIPMKENEPLEKPISILGTDEITPEQEEFQKAQSMVVFDGFAYKKIDGTEYIFRVDKSMGELNMFTRNKELDFVNDWSIRNKKYKIIADLTNLGLTFKII